MRGRGRWSPWRHLPSHLPLLRNSFKEIDIRIQGGVDGWGPVNAQRSPSINTSLDADVDFLERIAKEGEVGREMAPGAPPPPSAHPSRRARVKTVASMQRSEERR